MHRSKIGASARSILLLCFSYTDLRSVYMRKEVFQEGEFYHIYSRGVDKRQIFARQEEYIRFVNAARILNSYLTIPPRFNVYEIEPKELLTSIDPYVEVIAVCLMQNHYHIIVKELQKSGISKFLQKLNSSHTHFYNILHERTGRLFEGPFGAKHIDKPDYGHYITYYVHLNPIKLLRRYQIGTEEGFNELIRYPWSSLALYVGEKNALSDLVNLGFRDEVLGLSASEYKEFAKELYYQKCTDLRSVQENA